MAKASGGGGRAGRGGGAANLPRLAPGYKYGKAITPSASTLKVGDQINVSTSARSARGEITKVNRTTVEVTAPYFNQTVTYKIRMGDLTGGYVGRGNTVYPVR